MNVIRYKEFPEPSILVRRSLFPDLGAVFFTYAEKVDNVNAEPGQLSQTATEMP
jgi:hypothetical protein